MRIKNETESLYQSEIQSYYHVFDCEQCKWKFTFIGNANWAFIKTVFDWNVFALVSKPLDI